MAKMLHMLGSSGMRVLWGNCFKYHKIFYIAWHAFVIHNNEPYALLVSEYFNFIPLMLVIV